MKNSVSLSLAVASLLFLGGCSMTPELNIPVTQLPETQAEVSPLLQEKWWEAFQSPTLNSAVEKALKNNSDLEQAAIRVAQTRAAFNLSKAELMPNLTGSASADKTQVSENGTPYTGIIYENYALSGILSFELDLFGKLREAKKQAASLLLAQQYNREALRQAVVAQVVDGYFGIVILEQQEQIAQETLKTRKETYEYRKKQFDQGATTELILRQAESEVESTRVELYNIRNILSSAKSAFALLLGESPGQVFACADEVQGGMEFQTRIEIPEGIPSDILERRPDVQSALAQLKAANFAIGSAKAAYFPSISLTGSTGYQSAELNDLFDNGSGVWGIGADLLTPIFDFGRIESRVDSATESQKLALSVYVQTVRSAFKDIFDALNSYRLVKLRQEAQVRQIKALERTLALANLRFEEGYSSYLEVLDAERNLFGVKIALANSELSLINATVALYKALGGGWKTPSEVTENM